MRCTTFPRITRSLLMVVVFIQVAVNVSPAAPIDPLQEINRFFTDSVSVETNDDFSIEFCPDNTCVFVVANKRVSLEILKDFAYLYVYFFSTYYVLDEWRNQEQPKLIAKQILSKDLYRNCKSDVEEQAARCLLCEWSRTSNIQLYAVRYDENVRSLDRVDIYKATAVAFPKRQK